MAVETPCQTPGAVYSTSITPQALAVEVQLPVPLDLTEAEAELLENLVHNAMELVLRPYFYRRA